ncbi:MAG: NADH-quinone oxidoreductase subunit L [Actinomycetota bacterium]
MLDLVWLIPAFPLLGFVTLLVLGRRLGEPMAGWVATGAAGGSFAATVLVYFAMLGEDAEERTHELVLFDWVPAGGLEVEAGFLADPLSITMCLFVTGVASLIHMYAIGYMHGDEKFSKFFLYLNLFLFSMTILVLGNNMVLTFLGWEGVGACSYFLISFWFHKDEAPAAGKKAFVTNRVGDFGYMLAMFLVFQFLGTLQYVEITEKAGNLASTSAAAITLLLLLAAAGKSAQIPLFVWLPDAMAGPTPVSAMVHAATMVTSGVYLTARMNAVLFQAPDWSTDIIAWVGAITALIAATAAVAQNDIKRVLAYSTISQLGYMFLAIGLGAYVAAIFHVITHAFFKALLFLGSGSVIHGMHDEQDMRRMGGLLKVMPFTGATFIVGWLAIAGVPPFSGFWSKDEILLFAWEQNIPLAIIGFVVAILTAYYMSRQVFMVFFGEPRWDAEIDGEPPEHEIHPHESSPLMWLPLVALAGLAFAGGFINTPITKDLLFLEHFLEPVFEERQIFLEAKGGEKLIFGTFATLTAVVGIVMAAQVYLRRKGKGAVEPELFENAWYIDDTYAKVTGGPGRQLFDAASTADQRVIDGTVNGVGTLVRQLGQQGRGTATGLVRNYAIPIAIGAVVLGGWFLTRASF